MKKQTSRCRLNRKLRARRPAVGFDKPPADSTGFTGLLLELISWTELCRLTARKNGAGRPTHKLSRGQLLVATIFHYTINYAGAFSQHLLMLMGIQMSDGSLSERRQALPFEVFEELLRRALRLLVQPSAEAFYRGMRLAAIDGVEFSVGNHEPVNRQLGKGRNQRNKSAFAKLRCAVLLEVIMHNPLAAVLGRVGQSEWQLAKGLIEHLPAGCLLLADRLYGCGAFICSAWKGLQKTGGHFLIRAKVSAKVVRVIKRLADGTALVEINAWVPGDRHRIAETVVVREIEALLKRKGGRPVKVRFWTSLLDPSQAPAHELVVLYAKRWEHELYFRELKANLGINNLLQSQTVDTAAQELVAMIIGSALVATERSKLKPGEELTHRISFLKVSDLLEPLWLTLLLGADILSASQKQQLVDRFYWMAAQMKMQKKRARSCPRVIRQRTLRWPRKANQKTLDGPLAVTITKPNPRITETY
jgi:hypothetical protein